MAYVYADWKQQATLAEQVARGQLYVEELDNKITATVSSGGKSRDSSSLLGLRTIVAAEVEKYEHRLAKANGNGPGTAHPVRFGGC